MKTLLMLLCCCCLAANHLSADPIRGNDITHQDRHGDVQRGDNAAPALRTEATDMASSQHTCQPEDIHTVLREMSSLVTEQRVELRHTRAQMEAMETRLRASENKVETLERTMEEKKVVIMEQAAALKALGGNVTLTGSRVEELRREREERRVSFSVSLLASSRGNTGPYSGRVPLVYKHIIANVGNYYNPNTGVFTAPVRGVYHFVIFAIGSPHASTATGINLYKNGEHVVIAYHHNPNHSVTPANAASLLLEVGDVVYVKLWPHCWVYDDQNHYTTFSGHLLFPM